MNLHKELPNVTIIIPSYKSSNIVQDCLLSIKAQKYSGSYEIILIADEQNTTEKLVRELDLERTRVISSKDKPGAKRNLAVKFASSELLVFCDDDILAPELWLHNLVQPIINNPEIGAIGGPNLTPPNSDLRERCSGYLFSSFFGSGKMANRYRVDSAKTHHKMTDESELISCNLGVRKEILNTVQFPNLLWPNEENVFLHDVKSNGWKISYNPEAFVYHKRKPLFIPHCKQVFNYGLGRAQMIKMRPDSGRIIHLVPSAFAIAIIAGVALGMINNLIATSFLGLLAIYFTLASFSSINLAIKNKNWKALPFLIPGYFLHHLSYGLGFMKGILKKVKY